MAAQSRPVGVQDRLRECGELIDRYAALLAGRNPILGRDDLCQVGAIAVMEYVASGRYDERKAVPFPMAVRGRIYGEMVDEIRRHSVLSMYEYRRRKRLGERTVKTVQWAAETPHPLRHDRHDGLAVDDAVHAACVALGDVATAADRAILRWRFCRGWTLERIAAQLGQHESTVSRRLAKILSAVRSSRLSFD